MQLIVEFISCQRVPIVVKPFTNKLVTEFGAFPVHTDDTKIVQLSSDETETWKCFGNLESV